MSVFDGSDKGVEWVFEGPLQSCFLCGGAVGEGKVIHWRGSAGVLIKAFGPINKALDVFFHPGCVPLFCRRILSDWESVRVEDRGR